MLKKGRKSEDVILCLIYEWLISLNLQIFIPKTKTRTKKYVKFILTLQQEKSNSYKVGRLFDVLLTSPLMNAYDVLCAVLVKEYAWLSKELQTDSQCEKGNLTIDEDVMKEAGMLVHRFVTDQSFVRNWNRTFASWTRGGIYE